MTDHDPVSHPAHYKAAWFVQREIDKRLRSTEKVDTRAWGQAQ